MEGPSPFARRFVAPPMQRPAIHCVQVNDVRLEGAECSYCLQVIRRAYVRKISTGAIYCGFQCYGATRQFRMVET